MTPPAPTRIREVPGSYMSITTAVAALAMPACCGVSASNSADSPTTPCARQSRCAQGVAASLPAGDWGEVENRKRNQRAHHVRQGLLVGNESPQSRPTCIRDAPRGAQSCVSPVRGGASIEGREDSAPYQAASAGVREEMRTRAKLDPAQCGYSAMSPMSGTPAAPEAHCRARGPDRRRRGPARE